jgi:2Fe-2S ferredoxin
MPKITFISADGRPRVVEAAAGLSAMEAAVQNLVPGIDGDCGGATACGTCHVHVDPEWRERVGGPSSDMEQQMLELSDFRCASSRLSCQITLTAALDGLVLRMPEGQH